MHNLLGRQSKVGKGRGVSVQVSACVSRKTDSAQWNTSVANCREMWKQKEHGMRMKNKNKHDKENFLMIIIIIIKILTNTTSTFQLPVTHCAWDLRRKLPDRQTTRQRDAQTARQPKRLPGRQLYKCQSRVKATKTKTAKETGR